MSSPQVNTLQDYRFLDSSVVPDVSSHGLPAPVALVEADAEFLRDESKMNEYQMYPKAGQNISAGSMEGQLHVPNGKGYIINTGASTAPQHRSI
jgi:hypothetical protein